MKIFAARGFSAATIRAIAREAGVAEGTIYLYFPSKRDILLAIFRSLVLESMEDLLARPDRGDDEAFLRELVADRIRRLRANSRPFRFALTELPYHGELRDQFYREIALEQLERVKGFLRDRMRDGRFRPLRPEVAARAFQGMYTIFAIAEILFEDPEVARLTAEELAEEVVRLFLYGALARPPHGRP